MSNAQQQIDAIVARIRAEAYRQGWQDAMTALRKAALRVRYDCPTIEYPNGFAGLPDHLHSSGVTTLQTPQFRT